MPGAGDRVWKLEPFGAKGRRLIFLDKKRQKVSFYKRDESRLTIR